MAKTTIKVVLVGESSNAFAILGKVKRALTEGNRQDLVEPFMKDAMSGDYDHLLRTAQDYVEVE